MKDQLEQLFTELNRWIERQSEERRNEGLLGFGKTEVKILGQMSLLANERVSTFLSLAQTGDVDAFLRMENLVQQEFRALLKKRGLVYDEQSGEIWIPDGARFEELFQFEHVQVQTIDPESALVSKAVKAPGKNRQLIRQAIASGEFARLVERIESSGGDLEFFARDE